MFRKKTSTNNSKFQPLIINVLQKTKKGLSVQYLGSIDDDIEDTNPNARTNYVENAVSAILKNKNVEVKQTSVNGCDILLNNINK